MEIGDALSADFPSIQAQLCRHRKPFALNIAIFLAYHNKLSQVRPDKCESESPKSKCIGCCLPGEVKKHTALANTINLVCTSPQPSVERS
mmetsp:Transcript_408/g.774  ORF Transcript_408/g.774 Transcript_408/m.774 type:complete len:90 (-) Transcript_408:1108-1377(-)